MPIDVENLVTRLNPLTKKALESAASLCLKESHFSVDLAHFLLKLFDQGDGDLRYIVDHFKLKDDLLRAQLQDALDHYPKGCTTSPVLSPHLLMLLEKGWSISSLTLNHNKIRSSALLLAVLEDDTLKRALAPWTPSLLQISAGALRENIQTILLHSRENLSPVATTSQDKSLPLQEPASREILDQYTHNLTLLALEGKLDPVMGRDQEIHQLLDILLRRRQNNPILVGEAGVGKTAIVEGLAQRLSQDGGPLPLRGAQLLSLDLTLLQAGATARGEFEERLKHLLHAIKTSPTPILLFVDEAHTLIGAGGQSGLGDAANLLKPALARGELRLIAATTWPEYKKYIEQDPALSRRFELVKVLEPSVEDAIQMVRFVSASLAAHHQVVVHQDAIEAAVKLSQRFLPERRLPDKAISLLDTACARVALSYHHTPMPLQERENQLKLLKIQRQMLVCEIQTSSRSPQDLPPLDAQIEELTKEVDHFHHLWQQAKSLLDQLYHLHTTLFNSPAREPLSRQVQEIQEALTPFLAPLDLQLQVNRPLVAQVLHSWTGIPLETMIFLNNHISASHLFDELRTKIIGQQHALRLIADRVSCYFSQLTDPLKPMGIFALVGPSGVGKTETAHALSALLTGNETSLIRINMTEFQEAHSVATLKGAPPGYVGYGKGGVLTEAIRRNPYSVILLDEIEKAHPDVMELFYQVFDKGILEDGEGLEVDFRNTLIILTSNLGAQTIIQAWQENNTQADDQFMTHLQDLVLPELEHHLRPSLVARLQVIPYHPLGKEELHQITRLKLSALEQRLRNHHPKELIILDQDVAKIVAKCQKTQHGARLIDGIINQSILPHLSEIVLKSDSATTIHLEDILHVKQIE